MRLSLNQIGQITLAVSDVDRAEEFFGATLGLRKLYRFGDLCFFDCARCLEHDPEKADASVRQSSVIYFRSANIAWAVGELEGRGGVVRAEHAHLIANLDHHVLSMAFFTDPDGHTLASMQEAPKGYSPAS